MCFNLLDREWIPIIWANGTPGRIGIRDALTKAGDIREVCAASPLDTVALYRFLLAVLQWCKGEPTDDEVDEIGRIRAVPREWLVKLDSEGDYAERFLLLGGAQPFYQHAAASRRAPAVSLIHELPCGTNVAHFRHIRDFAAGVCLACCATGLARLPAFATSMGAGNYPGINQKPPLYAIALGETLLETLLINWPRPCRPTDCAAWDMGELVTDEKDEIGVLEGFTWLPRRIVLGTAGTLTGRCEWCGSQTDRLCQAILRRGPDRVHVARLKARVLAEKWRDPQVTYLRRPAKSKTSEGIDTGAMKAPDGLSDPLADNGAWREIWSHLLAGPSEDAYLGPAESVTNPMSAVHFDRAMAVQLVGFPTDGKAKYYDAWLQSIRLPGKLLADHKRREALWAELMWLGELIHRTLDPRIQSRSWKLPVAKLSDATFLQLTALRPGRKCRSKRAALAAWSSEVELLLQRAFRELATVTGSCEDTAFGTTVTRWRDEVRAVLVRHLRRAIGGMASPSPLRRREAEQMAEYALDRAMHDAEHHRQETTDSRGQS